MSFSFLAKMETRMSSSAKDHNQREASSSEGDGHDLNRRNRLKALLGGTAIAVAVGIACAALLGPMPALPNSPVPRSQISW
jgi:hypothetical protein